MSETIQCDLAELIDRGIYTDDDAIEHIKEASAYTVKTAVDVPALMQLFANPVLAPLAREHGFASFSPGGPSNLYEKLLYEQQLQDKMRAAQMAAQSDRGTYMDTIRGLAAITGQEWTPDRAASAERFSSQIANVSPMLMQLNPGLFEKLHGRRGSAALMASRMMDTARQFGTNPEHAATVSSLVTSNLANDPTWANGLSAGEIGNMYKQLYSRGMIPPGDPSQAADALRDMSAPLAVLKEMGGAGSMEELEAMAPGMVSQIPPRELALKLREQGILSKSPNLYGASSGKQQNLMQGAANSRRANQVGATLRLGSVAGFDVDPAEVAGMNTGQWINYMKSNGVDPSQSRAALGATSANQEQIYRRNVAPIIYAEQKNEMGGNLNRYFGEGVGGVLMNMPHDVMMDGNRRNKALSKSLGISPIDAETLWGRANTMMSRRYGMDAWDANNLYNNDTMARADRSRNDAAHRARMGSYYAGYLPSSPTQSFFESIQKAGPDTNVMDIAAETAGLVPMEDLPDYFKQSGDMKDLLSQVNAELVGSRGRARKYGRPEPEDSDHDYVAFSDDADEQDKYLKLLRQLGTSGYKLHDRPGGFLTASGDNTDLSVYPTSKRDDIHKAWELIEGGMSKDEAWEQVEKEADSGIKQRIEDARAPQAPLIPINPNWFRIPPPNQVPPGPPPAVAKALRALPNNLERLMKNINDEFAPKATPPPHPKELSPPNMLPNIPTKGGIPSAKVAELTDLLKGVTDTMALVSIQKETIDKRHAEQEENRKVLKAVQRNERERKARRIAASQGKLDVMLGKTAQTGWRIDKSDIAGKGLFSTMDFEPEDLITKAIDVLEHSGKYPWKQEYQQTDACRYTNHTRKPNAKLVREGDEFNLVAIKKIPNGVEVTVNYGDANREMGDGFHYTHNGEDYVTDNEKEVTGIVVRDEIKNLIEKLSEEKKKKKKKKRESKYHT